MVRKLKGNSVKTFREEKIMRYNRAKRTSTMEEVAEMCGGDREIEVISALASAMSLLETDGFTLATAIDNSTGIPFTLLRDQKTGNDHDLEACVILAYKTLLSMGGQEDLAMPYGNMNQAKGDLKGGVN